MARFSIIFIAVCSIFGSVCAASPEVERGSAVGGDFREVATDHFVEIGGAKIPYRAVAGTFPLKDDKGGVKADLFYVAYTRSDIGDSTKRPIAFCFNGGPGSSSIWLHMGILGPKRVDLVDEAFNAPPYSYLDNEYSLLDVADLVFIDPISTGYSRAAEGEDPKQFHGVEEDVKWVAEFLRLYLTRAQRWESPKYLIGESYGTTRAAALAAYLHEELAIYLNGVVLVSSVLDFQTLDKLDEGNDLPSLLYLPTYTAAAWYHNKLPKDLQDDFQRAIEQSKAFAYGDYALALLKGDSLDGDERKMLAETLARYTGLTPGYIEQMNFRVNIFRFAKELLRTEGRTIGRFDVRYRGTDSDKCAQHFEYDPSADAIFGAFTAAFNSYIRDDLHWESDEQYRILANVQPWNYGKATNCYLNVAPTLRNLMLRNRDLRILVCNGYYDLATPFFTSDYTFSHLNIDKSIAKNISMTYYMAGHMMYIHPPSLVAMSRDLKAFIEEERSQKS